MLVDADVVRRDRRRRPGRRWAEIALTGHGADPTDVELFTREEREFTISDGTVVQGWLVRDPERPRPQPLLLDVHGGPHNAWNGAADDVHLYHQELAARGWAVLLVNPRGSDGYGEAFFDGRPRRLGRSPTRRTSSSRSTQLVAEGLADPDRLAVTGYSYGGYMTCYLTGHDDRFAAAVAGGVVSDLVSMGGTSDDGAPARRATSSAARRGTMRERYAAMSPLTHVDQVRTPTLVLHGAADVALPGRPGRSSGTPRCASAGVPTELVLYPGARTCSSSTGRPSHRLDYNRRVVDWVEQYAGARGAPRRRHARTGSGGSSVLAERHHVPGAQLGILRTRPERDDELVERGVRRAEHGDRRRPATADSVFQIGSITKVWTATRRHAAGRRGPARPRRAGRRGAARAAARRPRRHRAASRSGTC